MKEQANISLQNADYKKTETVAAVGIHLFFALAGFMTTKAAVLTTLLPFGIAWLSSVPQTFIPAAAIGVFFGYFSSALSGDGFHYVAALFAVLSIRILIGGNQKTSRSVPFLCTICFLSSFFTAAVAFRAASDAIVKVLVESVLSAVGAYFFLRCFHVVRHAKAGMATEELPFLFFGLCIPVMGLGGIRVSGISLGHILGFLFLLIAAKYGGIISGSLCGIMLSFTMFLNGESALLAVLFAFLGLFCGLFAPFGKYLQILPAFFLTAVTVFPRGTAEAAAGIIEFLLGAILFLLLPRQVGIPAGRFLAPSPKMATLPSVKKTVSMRLDAASEALADISQTIEQVADELSKINTPDFAAVITRIEEDACTGCKLRLHCWEKRKSETAAAVLAITNAVKKGVNSPQEGAPTDFAGRCVRLPQVAAAAERHFSDYASRIAAENRIAEVRNVVSDQFDGISTMLCELSGDLENNLRFDHALAEKATAALQTLGIHTEECNCRIDRYGRAVVELKIKKEPDTVLNKLQIMKMTSLACDRDFGVPSVTGVGESLFLTLNEYPAIRVDIGAEQKCASASGMCGDSYRYFSDKGRFYMLLSDGMGTGGRAAVDGSMATGLLTRLLKAGFGYDCSLKILNSAMLFKSTDESLATVDIASVDLFTGKTELYKAGAAPTFIRRSGRAGKAESASLPAGILRDIRFDKASVRCKAGDIIVLVSDGAMCDGAEWIKEDLEHWDGGSAQALSEQLCESARRRADGDRRDDITVVVAILKNAS